MTILFLGTFSATLTFKVRDCDPTTGEPETEEGYDDDYSVRSPKFEKIFFSIELFASFFLCSTLRYELNFKDCFKL